MNIKEKLQKIQAELKAPKGQFNSFGKYRYRSSEDILEAVKPLLDKYGAVLLVSDEVKLVGDRYYVMAEAKVVDTEEDSSISTTAYAREGDSKKGMDSSQVTGSTSSYARKYALNGLFSIDDTKDSDYTNKHDSGAEKSVKSNLITDTQLELIIKLAKDKNYASQMSKYIRDKYSKETSRELSSREADEIIKMLNGL